MAYVKNLFDQNFIQYASYVIRDRAIPEITDGLKPVQRRIIHTLIKTDDGRYTKVANVVGKVMAYHPHGDASIYNALVNLANKELFIDKQGNFGNMYTGDGASAPRYIECRLRQITKDILNTNPRITEYVDTYDGRDVEPVAFKAKLPLVLIMGTEGIAVGMSTNILSHNIHEVIDAERKCLRGEEFQLYPDFATGGLIDVSEYGDGLGKIVTRAKLDTSDDKKIIIKELPYGSTTESLCDSIEKAVKNGKIKASSIQDYTSDEVNIEIKLQRGVYTKDVIDSLYAFTDCEQTVYCNLLVIKDNMPVQMTCTEVIQYHSKQLVSILKQELELEKADLTDKLHIRTLERIFVEERIYKQIEEMKTEAAVTKAVKEGFTNFKEQLIRDICDDDIEHLLKIPIRRISLYDMKKNKAEVTAIKSRIREINKLLKNLVDYAVSWLDNIEQKLVTAYGNDFKRRTKITNINAVDAKAVAKRDIPLKYDEKTGNLGINVYGTELLRVSSYDKIIYVRKSGIFSVSEVPEKIFVGTELRYCGYADKDELSKVLFTIIYQDPETKFVYIKRCKVTAFIMNRDYFFAPEGMELLHLDTRKNFSFKLNYLPKAKSKVTSGTFKASDYDEKSLKAKGVRLVPREIKSIEILNDK